MLSRTIARSVATLALTTLPSAALAQTAPTQPGAPTAPTAQPAPGPQPVYAPTAPPQQQPPPYGQPAPQQQPPPYGQPAPQQQPPPYGQPAQQQQPAPYGQPAPQGQWGQPPPQQQQYPGQQPQGAWGAAPPPGQYEQAPPPAQRAGLPGFGVPLRLILSPGGSGTIATECDGSDCDFFVGDNTNETDYDHKLSFGLGADFLWTIGSAFRLGPGIQLGFGNEIEIKDGADDYKAGMDLAINFVAEAMFPVGPSSFIGPRGAIGLMLLFPSDDLEDDLKAAEDTCKAAGGSGCDSPTDARPGVDFQLGGGFMHAISDSLRFRADLMMQFYAINLYTSEAPGVDATFMQNLAGIKWGIAAGLEL